MARFFFDTDNGRPIRDDFGIECDNTSDFRTHALGGLADLAKEAIPAGHWRNMAVEVRDEQGEAVMQVSLRIEFKFPIA